MKFLKGLVIFICVVGVVIVGLGLYFDGLLFTKSLGVTYTQNDYNNAIAKLESISQNSSQGTQDSTTEFTSEEITAYLNEYPLDSVIAENIEVRINSDNTVDLSAKVNIAYVLEHMLTGKYSIEELQDNLPALGLLPNNVNVYLSGIASVEDNNFSCDVASASLQGIPLPETWIETQEAGEVAEMLVGEGLASYGLASYRRRNGAYYKSVSLQNGELVLDVTLSE